VVVVDMHQLTPDQAAAVVVFTIKQVFQHQLQLILLLLALVVLLVRRVVPHHHH